MKLVFSLLASLVLISLVGCESSKPGDVSLALKINDYELTEPSPILKVKKNDLVTITITTNKDLTFHLHGYDLKQLIPSGEEGGELRFEASATGSFPFTVHMQNHGDEHDHDESHGKKEKELGRIEVHP